MIVLSFEYKRELLSERKNRSRRSPTKCGTFQQNVSQSAVSDHIFWNARGTGGRWALHEGRPFARPTRGRADGDGQTPGVGSESGATRPRLFLFRTGKVISNSLS
ncbi:hypothetical protein TNCV_420851 [Trichonephila clavipes]|nr:hypothetical protein TNCV_420851 [Trichonephila clavipes]